MKTTDYKHDLLRNIGAVMSGAKIVRSRISDDNHQMLKLLEKMEEECAASLQLIKDYFKQIKREVEL